MSTASLPSTDDLVAELVDLNDRINALDERRATIKATLATLPPNGYTTQAGISFTVKAPSRRFDAERAYAALKPEQQALCVGMVPGLVKKQIPPAVIDEFMVAGTGSNTVVLG